MTYDLIYVNGDSYVRSGNYKKYADHLADFFGAHVINRAVLGSANSRIFRTSLRDLLELKHKHSNILACVSLSFIFRTELWHTQHDIARWRQVPHEDLQSLSDGDFVCIQPLDGKNWYQRRNKSIDLHEGKAYRNFCRNYIDWYDIEAETVDLLAKIILFANWCENNNIDYIIFSPMYQETIDFSAPFVANFYEEMKQNSRILDIFEFSFLEWCLQRNHAPVDNHEAVVNNKPYKVGHMGPSGHKDFAEFLLERYYSR